VPFVPITCLARPNRGPGTGSTFVAAQVLEETDQNAYHHRMWTGNGSDRDRRTILQYEL
jgi:hypothetical protein